MKSNTSVVVQKFQSVHGKKYGYELVDFVNSKTKVKIRCKKHGVFEQRPDHHIEGKGCSKCGKGGKKFDLKYVIDQFHEAHPKGLYDYSQVVYVNAQSDVKIVCNKHQTYFFQTVSDHKRGYGCPMCKGRLPKDGRTIQELFHQLYGDLYDFSAVNWEGLKLSSLISYTSKNNEVHTTTIRNLLINGY
jgi:Zn finger protein HypA/HybF involved in hydrogenase expression